MSEWKTIPGFSDYQCSINGAMKSLDRYAPKGKNERWLYKGRIINMGRGDRIGKITLINDEGKKITLTRHRAVYMAWIGEVPDGKRVYIVDKDKPVAPDNLALQTARGKLPLVKTQNKPVELEGFNSLMQSVLSSRLSSGIPQLTPAWM